MIQNTIDKISWNVSEEEYRNNESLSYSTISSYSKLGFKGIEKLFDKIESPSLTFGSCVDSLITGGEDEFNGKFSVLDLPKLSQTLIDITKSLPLEGYENINEVPDNMILSIANDNQYQQNWNDQTRINKIRTLCSDYYNALKSSSGKIIITNDMYQEVLACVRVLKESTSTINWFAKDSVFDNVRRYYQLKFITNLNGVMYRCMIDELLVDYDSKTIYPIDLKTSSFPEYDFPQHFVDYNYHMQARLYYRILSKVLSEDEYFKDFKIEDFRFIVVCKTTLNPLVWKFDKTKEYGDLNIGDYILKDPEIIGKELQHYLTYKPIVPDGIKLFEDNDICEFLNKQ